MNKFNKKDSELLTKYHSELTAYTKEYNDFILTLNARIQSVVDDFKNQHSDRLLSLETDMQSTADLLEKRANDQIEKMESYMSERTEKWHDTESGFNFTEWKELWEEFSYSVAIIPNFDYFNGMEISLEQNIEIPKFNR